MILLDANLLIYVVNEDAAHHNAVREWFEGVLSGAEPVGIAWVVLLAFLRLTTRPGLFAKSLSVKSAFDVTEEWLEQPSVSIVHPGLKHHRILRQLLMAAGTGGNLTTDAHLAALAIEQDAELFSLDHDFGRFPGLKWRNPLTQNKP